MNGSDWLAFEFPQKQYTFNAWVEVDTQPSGDNSFLFEKKSVWANAEGYALFYSDTGGPVYNLAVRKQSTASFYDVNKLTGGGVFSMVTFTWNTTHVNKYINATPVDSDAYSTALNGNTALFYLGVSKSLTGSLQDYWDGMIDEVGVWNRSLTQSEITELWNSGGGFAYPFIGTTTINTNTYDVEPETENTITQLNLSIQTQNHNLTASNYGAVNYNGTLYTATKTLEQYGVSGNVTYAANVTTPIVYTNNSAVTYTWYYNLTINASDEATYNTSSTQNIIYYNSHHLTITANDSVTNATLSGFTISATNGTHTYNKTDSGSSSQIILPFGLWNLSINVSGYSENTTLNYNATGLTGSLNVYIYETQSVFLWVYDEITEAPITNVSFRIINNNSAANYSTTNGTLYVNNLQLGEHRIEYEAIGYPERLYYITLTATSSEQLNLYSLSNTSATQIDITIKDEVSDAVTDTYFKLLRYYISCNCFRTVEIGKTNFDGKTFVQAEQYEEFYKVIIADSSTTFLETSPFKITSSTLTFFINVAGTDPTVNFDYEQGVISVLTFNNATNNFVYTWSDNNNNLVQACLTVYTETFSATTSYNSSCDSSAAGSIILGVQAVNGTTYKAVSSVYFDSEEYITDTLYKTYKVGAGFTGAVGVFLAIILVIVFAFIGIWNANVSIILTAVSLIFLAAFGIISIPTTALMAIVGATLILVFQNRA